jgi:mono/diheme cytochrome c family protein
MFRSAVLFALLVTLAAALPALSAPSNDAQLARGRYLVSIAGCNDCHTPGYFFGKPDMARYLGGSDVGFEIPGLGVFVGRNLTPDKETGLGNWTTDEIVHALQTGERPDGRVLAPIMPWRAFANFTKEDVTAIAVYLKSLKPVHYEVPGPFGPGEKASVFVMRIVPPGAVVAGAPKAKNK